MRKENNVFNVQMFNVEIIYKNGINWTVLGVLIVHVNCRNTFSSVQWPPQWRGEEGDKKNALIQPLQVNLRFEREDLRGSDQYIKNI